MEEINSKIKELENDINKLNELKKNHEEELKKKEKDDKEKKKKIITEEFEKMLKEEEQIKHDFEDKIIPFLDKKREFIKKNGEGGELFPGGGHEYIIHGTSLHHYRYDYIWRLYDDEDNDVIEAACRRRLRKKLKKQKQDEYNLKNNCI